MGGDSVFHSAIADKVDCDVASYQVCVEVAAIIGREAEAADQSAHIITEQGFVVLIQRRPFLAILNSTHIC